jgi:hypothetical protein
MTEIKYNPMSKEFQDECKKLGLTGNQLTAKYKREGKSIEKDEVYFKHGDRRSENGRNKQYTKEQLLWYLIQFYERYGRPPTENDFRNNPEYPSFMTYVNYFGNWSNALKLVGLDVDSMVKKGIIETSEQKRRFAEIIIRDHFDNSSIDLAGENKTSSCDGICPAGLYYDVKSSRFYKEYKRYEFGTKNKYKDEIELYYFLAFNEDWTKLDYGWRISGELVESSMFIVGPNLGYEFTVDNMKEYDITEKLREVLNKYGYFEKIINYRKAKEKGLTIYEYDKQLYDGYIITE